MNELSRFLGSPEHVAIRRERDREDAEYYAGLVQQFWHAMGYPNVKAWPVQRRQNSDPKEPNNIWVTASNLLRGMPEGADPKAIAAMYRLTGRGR
jgi:hypothetical protein